jgi:GNAT superfamily N-acetyltransferase
MTLPPIVVERTRPEHFSGIQELCTRVYPESPPWTDDLLSSHLNVFPEGQFVAVDKANGHVVGMAASLVIKWDDYEIDSSWRAFTDAGRFTNHDPVNGRTLYGAEVMVDPTLQRRGIGAKLYTARRNLVESLGLLRIRAGARLRGYGRYASKMTPEEYVIKVIRGELKGPTLTFQLRHGFEVIAVVSGYLRHDPESLGYAAVIEWLNKKVARPEDFAAQPARFKRPVFP